MKVSLLGGTVTALRGQVVQAIRAQVVKAVAQAIRDADDNTPSGEAWENFDAHAVAALDAALATLWDGRVQWADSAHVPGVTDPQYLFAHATRLLAVLRHEETA